jgi:hypothetical protein
MLTDELELLRREETDFARRHNLVEPLVAAQTEIDAWRRNNVSADRIERRRAELLREAEAVLVKEREKAVSFATARCNSIRRSYSVKKSKDAMVSALFDAATRADTLSLTPTKTLTARKDAADSMSRPQLAGLVRELRARGEATVADTIVGKLPSHDDAPWESDPEYQKAVAALEDIEKRTKDTRSIRVQTEAGAEVTLPLESLLL